LKTKSVYFDAKFGIAIGTVVVSLLLAVVLVMFMRKSGAFATTEAGKITIMFSEVNGLKTGDPVRVRGVEVGKVEAIELGDSVVIVHVVLYRPVTLKTDASAQILVRELLGGRFIELTLGNSLPAAENNKMVQGVSVPGLAQSIATFGKLIHSLDEKKLNSLTNNLNELSAKIIDWTQNENAGSISPTKVFAELMRTLRTANELITDLRTVKLALKAGSIIDRLEETIDSAAVTLDEFKKIARHTNALLPTFERVVDSLAPVVLQLAQDIKQFRQESTIAGKLIYSNTFANKFDSLVNSMIQTFAYIRNNELKVGLKIGKGKSK
jgi:phospholipid/cholesterol/gamma-HCH transport system substrate-binding protein